MDGHDFGTLMMRLPLKSYTFISHHHSRLLELHSCPAAEFTHQISVPPCFVLFYGPDFTVFDGQTVLWCVNNAGGHGLGGTSGFSILSISQPLESLLIFL